MAEATQVEAPAKPSPEEKRAAAEAEVDALVKKGLKALDEFEKLDQKQVDRIVAKASVAALNKHLVLAKMAVEETHRGLVEDKATKNIFACEHVTNYLAGQKTVGIIREDDVLGRVGGDEFVVFSKADAAVCEARMQAVSSALAAQDYSISYGIAVCEAANGLRELVREADEKMLGSKRAYYAEHDRRRPR